MTALHEVRKSWLVAIALLLAPAVPVTAEEGATLAAMKIAHARELGARAQYFAFATRAEADGQPAVACLFRAVARAESVHAANHAAVIEQLHGKPSYRPVEFEVHGTEANLEKSIELELQELSIVYRRFGDYARAEYLYNALASFNYARVAETTHEWLFRTALRSLGPDPTFFVCLGDGSVFAHAVKRCPNCGSAGSWVIAAPCRP